MNMKKIIFPFCAALLGGVSLLSLPSCGDALEPYPWIVDGDANDTEGAGARDMEVCEAELRGAIPFMINYSHEPTGTWAPHKYQYYRANTIDNYAGYWTTSKAIFAFGPALPTLYYEPNGYMGGARDNQLFIQSKNAVMYAATMEDEDGNNVAKPEWRAVALIIQSYLGHEVTDFFGVCPYLDWRSGKQSNLQYMSGPEVYKQIFADLDEAVEILKERQPSVAEFMKVEGNDAYKTCCDWEWQRWVKFANSIKLRMAMNMVDYVDPNPVYGPKNKPFVAQTIAEEAFNDGVLMPGDRDIAYRTPHDDTRSVCLWQICESWDDLRLNASMENILRHFKSPLLEEWFDSGAYPIKGKDGRSAPGGYINGIYPGIMAQNIPSKQAQYGPFGKLADKQKAMDQPFLKLTEILFIRAEGALRGWNMGGTAQELYEQGIRTCFEQYELGDKVDKYLEQDELPAVKYVDYYDSNNNCDGRVSIGVKWNEADNAELKLEKIITQKWIAVFPLSAEAWTTFRRTGYPRIFPCKYNNLDKVDLELQIRRMNYTSTDNNATEMNQITALLGGSQTCGDRVFWDVNSALWGKDEKGWIVPNNHLQ